MDNTVETLCDLIELVAKTTNRSPSTISRLVTGSGATIRRLRATDTDGKLKHRITTARAARAMTLLSDMWPSSTPWPTNISRPKSSKSRRAA